MGRNRGGIPAAGKCAFVAVLYAAEFPSSETALLKPPSCIVVCVFPAIFIRAMTRGKLFNSATNSAGAQEGTRNKRDVQFEQLSGVSSIETDLRFSGREDFWVIIAARSEDETEIRAGKAAGGRRDRGHSGGHVDTY